MMQKGEAENLKMYCLHPRLKNTLILALISMPIWCFLIYAYFLHCLVLGSVQCLISYVVGATLFLIATTALYLTISRQIKVLGGRLFLGHNLKGIELNSLKRIDIAGKDPGKPDALILSFDSLEKQKVNSSKIKLNSLSTDSVRKLVSTLEKLAPACTVALPVKKYLEPPNQHAQNLKDGLELDYRKQTALARVLALVSSGKHFIVKIYAVFWSTVAVFMIGLLLSVLAGQSSLAAHILNGIGMLTWGFVHNYAATLQFAFLPQLLFLGIVFTSAVAGVSALAPNRLKLTASGLEVYRGLGKFKRRLKRISWQNLSRVQIDRKCSVDQNSWELRLLSASSKPLKLQYSAFSSPEDRNVFLMAIGNLAPHAQIDESVAELFALPQSGTYTELWLQSLQAPPTRERTVALASGHVLRSGRYQVDRMLVVGGQATTYLGRDLSKAGYDSAPTRVVLKEFVLPLYVNKEIRRQALAKFENDARTLSELNHNQIVKLIDYFVEDHRAYLALEWVEGVSLREFVKKNGPLEEPFLQKLITQMLDILEHLHNLNLPMLHGDFTPDNLIISNDARLTLIDFDMATRLNSGMRLLGKQSYISPEQLRGRQNVQSDIYALGATIYFLSTGSDPEPISRSSLGGKYHKLGEIVERSTELNLSRRFGSISELRSFLSLSGESISGAGSESEDSGESISGAGSESEDSGESISGAGSESEDSGESISGAGSESGDADESDESVGACC